VRHRGRSTRTSSRLAFARLLVVLFDGYVYLVPFVEEADHFFLKTVIPSRKATRDYLLKGEPNAKR